MKNPITRLFASLLVLAMVLAALPMAAMADGSLQTAVVINPIPEERLNLRTAPTQDASSLAKYYNGTEVEIINYVDKNWAQVRVGTLTGYMRTKYLSTVLTSGQVDAMPQFVSTANEWALYEQPDRNSFATAFGAGETIRLMGFNDNWWHIEVVRQSDDYFEKMRVGFVPADSAHFLRISGLYGAGYDTAVVNNPNPKDRLNLRVSPYSDAASLGKYYNGTTVILLEDMIGDWWKVQIGDLVGYMDGYYLDTTQNQFYIKDARPELSIGADNTPMYEKQSTGSAVLMTFDRKETVTVLGFSPDWMHVLVGNTMGYIKNYNPNEPQDTEFARPEPVWQNANANLPRVEWPFAYDETVQVAIVNNSNPKDRLNLRTEPKQDGASLGKYYNGVRVVLLGETSGDFVKVSIGGVEGWMLAKYLEFSTDPLLAPASMMPQLVVDNPNPIGNLNLRSGRGTDTPSLGKYANGTPVTVMGFYGNWAHVIVDGQIGFMVSGYIQAAE